MERVKKVWSGMKVWQKVVTVLVGMALFGGLLPKEKPASPAPSAAQESKPASAPAVQGNVQPTVKAQNDNGTIPAERKDKVLADAKKVAALDVQVKTLSQQAREAFVTYFGQDNKKGHGLVEPMFNDAMYAMDQIDGSVHNNLAPEVQAYLDAVAVEATARVTLISKYMDALGGVKTAAEEAFRNDPELTKAMSKTSEERKALATRLGVTEDTLTGR